MTHRSLIILFSLGLGFANADSACKGPVPPAPVIADDIKVDVTDACTTITAVTPDAVVQLVCVTAEGVAALADIIAHQIKTNAVAGKDKCVTAHGQTICATPAQMAAAIRTLNARDGGK